MGALMNAQFFTPVVNEDARIEESVAMGEVRLVLRPYERGEISVFGSVR